MTKTASPPSEPKVLERHVRELDACFNAFRYALSKGMKPPPAEVELSPQGGKALMILAEKSPLTMSDLAEAVDAPLSTVTRIVERLIDKGMAMRSRIEEDRRVVRVEISGAGRKLVQHFMEQRYEMARRMLAALTPGEREIFIELMTKITRPRP